MKYFYLESYVYCRCTVNGVLLINLVDDKSLYFVDKKSIDFVNRLCANSYNTIEINEEEEKLLLVLETRKHFMGDVIECSSQPFQFKPEINIVSGSKAYAKTVLYSKKNIGSNISNCTLFVSETDSAEYISCKNGIKVSEGSLVSHLFGKIEKNRLMDYIQVLLTLNPEMNLWLCGVSLESLSFLSRKIIPNIIFVYSAKTLSESPEIQDFLKANNIKYVLLLDLDDEKLEKYDLSSPVLIGGMIANSSSFDLYVQLRRDGRNINPCFILDSANSTFLKSSLTFSVKELMGIKKKFQTLKSNNLINSNYWGSLYLFPDGNVAYSLDTDVSNMVAFDSLYDNFKKKFLEGDFSWTRIRNYEACKECVFRYLCPSPSSIENTLRIQHNLTCLLQSEAI